SLLQKDESGADAKRPMLLKLFSLPFSSLPICLSFGSDLIYCVMTLQTKSDEIFTSHVVFISCIAWLPISIRCSNVVYGVYEWLSALLTTASSNTTKNLCDLLPVGWIFELVDPHDCHLPGSGPAPHRAHPALLLRNYSCPD